MTYSDPFEQAFFVTVDLPCLQPFEDVNKRVSRLAANIPLIHHNLCPLSFVDVPENLSHLAKDLVPENDLKHFLKIAKEEIAALHEGNFARYRLRLSEFKDWHERPSGHLCSDLSQVLRPADILGVLRDVWNSQEASQSG